MKQIRLSFGNKNFIDFEADEEVFEALHRAIADAPENDDVLFRFDEHASLKGVRFSRRSFSAMSMMDKGTRLGESTPCKKS